MTAPLRLLLSAALLWTASCGAAGTPVAAADPSCPVVPPGSAPLEPLAGLFQSYAAARLLARDAPSAATGDGRQLLPLLERAAALLSDALRFEALLLEPVDGLTSITATLERLWRSRGVFTRGGGDDQEALQLAAADIETAALPILEALETYFDSRAQSGSSGSPGERCLRTRLETFDTWASFTEQLEYDLTEQSGRSEAERERLLVQVGFLRLALETLGDPRILGEQLAALRHRLARPPASALLEHQEGDSLRSALESLLGACATTPEPDS